MCGPYWSQWNSEELLSLHGVEPEREERPRVRRDEECTCGNVCMECLGMTWKEFM